MQGPRPFPDADALLAQEGFIRAIARPLVLDEGSIDDVVQETWLTALRTGPRQPASLRSWLATVARNIALKARRSGERRTCRERAVARPEPVASTADLLERVARHRRIVDAVLGLVEPYRSTILMRFYDLESTAQIAARLGISAAAVRWRLRRGFEMLRATLDADYGDRSAWTMALPVCAAAGARIGGGVMKAKVVLGVVVLCVVATFFFVWRAFDSDESASERSDAAQQPAEPAVVVAPEPGGPVRLLHPRTVRGRVRNRGGQPIDGAEVDAGSFGTRTDRDGAFSLRLPEGAKAGRVRAGAEGYESAEVDLPTSGEIEIALSGAVALNLRVVDEHAKPVSGAEVRWAVARDWRRHPGAALWFPGVPHVGDFRVAGTTDADGRCALTGLPDAAPVNLFARTPEGRYGSGGPFVAGGAIVERTLALEPSQPLMLFSRGAAADSRVSVSIARSDAHPLQDFKLVFEFTPPEMTVRLPAGRYELRFWAGRAVLATESLELSGPRSKEVPASHVRALDLHLADADGHAPPRSIAYLYTLGARGPGDPRKGPFFFLFRHPREIDGGRGRLYGRGDPAQEERAALYVVSPGHKAVAREVAWAAGETVSEARVVLEDGGRVEGVLDGAAAGTELEIVLLELEGFRSTRAVVDSGVTDDAGRFSLRAIGSGAYALRLAGAGFDLGRVSVEAGAVAQWRENVPSGSVRVHAQEGGPRPPTDLVLLGLGKSRGLSPLPPARAGSMWVFAALPDGDYLLAPRAEATGYTHHVSRSETEYRRSVDPAQLPTGHMRVRVEGGGTTDVTWIRETGQARRRISIRLPAEVRRERCLAATMLRVDGPGLAPQNLDWQVLRDDGTVDLACTPGQRGAVLVGVPLGGKQVAVLAVAPFERFSDVSTVLVSPPATLEVVREDERIVSVRLLSPENPFVLWGINAESGGNGTLMPGTWRMRLTGQNPQKKTLLRDEREVALVPGERKTVRVRLAD